MPVSCVPTGVKHLHHEALKYDIGVYFEANGHGTVVFSDHAVSMIRSRGGDKLSTLLDVINMTVGDAISDMLTVECVLANKGCDCDIEQHRLKYIVYQRLHSGNDIFLETGQCI